MQKEKLLQHPSIGTVQKVSFIYTNKPKQYILTFYFFSCYISPNLYCFFVRSPNKTDTSSSSAAAEDLLALRRVLNTVVTENVRLRAASIRSRLKRMKRLPTTFNYTASQARAAAITPLKTLSNPAITPSPSSPSTASTGSTKSTENNSINIDSAAIGSTATEATTSATALRTNQKMNLHQP